jgi:hypothetical protein
LVFLAWGGALLYGHYEVLRAIDRLRKGPDGLTEIKLYSCGSRAIPALIAELSLPGITGNSDWEMRISHYLSQAIDWADANDLEGGLSTRIPSILATDLPPEREKKKSEILSWWVREANFYPAWWEVWASKRRDPK